MTAIQIPNEEWFMVNRTKKWYKKKRHGNTYTEAFVIGDSKKYLIPNEEPVTVS